MANGMRNTTVAEALSLPKKLLTELDHRHLGEGCGEDACSLCLIQADIEEALELAALPAPDEGQVERVAVALRDSSMFKEPMAFWRGIAATAISALATSQEDADG